MSGPGLETRLNELGWAIAGGDVEAFVTRTGGHCAPVGFALGSRRIEPFAVAPWRDEAHEDLEPVLRVLRGDFFCMPFGGGGLYVGEGHPLHGETANADWVVETHAADRIALMMETVTRPARVQKLLVARGQALHSRHTILGLSGPMCFGTHAMVQCPSEGVISTSPMIAGFVFPGRFEDPAKGGYSSLLAGSSFTRLDEVALDSGGFADVSRFPAREGFDDLVMVVNDPRSPLAWTAIAFPSEGWAFVQAKDRRVLGCTVLWFSNGGRHYPPWNGRYRRVVGIEETTSYFHLGLRGSVAPNPVQDLGIPTFGDFNATQIVNVSTIQAVIPILPDFGRVTDVVVNDRGLLVWGENGHRHSAEADPFWLGL